MWMRVKNVTLKVVLVGALCIVGVLSFQLLRAQPGDGQDPPSVGDLVALLSSEDATVRAEAAKALGEMGPDAADAVDALAIAVSDNDFATRWHAMTALGEIGVVTDAVREAFAGMVREEWIEVRIAAVNAAWKIEANNAQN